jgi:hypothetical protein
MDTFDGTSDTIVHATYLGPDQPIEVFRVRRFERPIDIYLPEDDSGWVIEATALGGYPAILSYPAPGGGPVGSGLTRVSFFAEDIETTVWGPQLALDTAIRIAMSLQ